MTLMIMIFLIIIMITNLVVFHMFSFVRRHCVKFDSLDTIFCFIYDINHIHFVFTLFIFLVFLVFLIFLIVIVFNIFYFFYSFYLRTFLILMRVTDIRNVSQI